MACLALLFGLFLSIDVFACYLVARRSVCVWGGGRSCPDGLGPEELSLEELSPQGWGLKGEGGAKFSVFSP